MGDGRRRDEDEAPDARRARPRRAAARVPSDVHRGELGGVARQGHLRGEVHDARRRRRPPRAHGGRDRVTSPSTSSAPVTPEGRRCRVRTSCAVPDERGATAPPRKPLAPVTSTSHGRRVRPPAGEHGVRPPASSGAVDLRVVPDVGRQRRNPSTARDGPPRRRADGCGERRFGRVPARVGPSARPRDELLRAPAGRRRRAAARATPPTALDALLDADGRDDARVGDDDVRQPALDPEATLGVEVADVAGAVPAALGGRAARASRS